MVKTKNKTKKVYYYPGVGRRKESVCRIRLLLPDKPEVVLGEKTYKKGEIYVDQRPVAVYFPGNIAQRLYSKPLELTNSQDRFVILAQTRGGGKNSQLDAFILALARALEKVDASYRAVLKEQGLLKVDARVRERRKAGLAQKARREKQSPKR
jgi:small subunit ribosomal protein S9